MIVVQLAHVKMSIIMSSQKNRANLTGDCLLSGQSTAVLSVGCGAPWLRRATRASVLPVAISSACRSRRQFLVRITSITSIA